MTASCYLVGLRRHRRKTIVREPGEAARLAERLARLHPSDWVEVFDEETGELRLLLGPRSGSGRSSGIVGLQLTLDNL